MDRNYILLAVPVFFLFIGLELLLGRIAGRRLYRLDQAVTDLGCGVGQQITGLLFKGVLAGGYILAEERWGAVALGADRWYAWAIAFVGVDLLYYWWHRLSHEVNVLWAAHIVHHQSEDLNLAVALRQALFTRFTIWPFYLPLALLGVSPVVFFTVSAFSTLYQFWIHTELIGRLGPLEAVLNTPSHHRVHHAVNPGYLDKNYGATLIVWDRLFGTFAREEQAPVYGIVKPLTSRNPIWANFHYWVDLARLARAAPRWRDKLRVWIAPPMWRPEGLAALGPPPEVTPQTRPRHEAPASGGMKLYATGQLVATIGITVGMLSVAKGLGWPVRASGVGLVLLTLATTGGLIDGRRWALPLELVRLPLVVGAAVVLAGWTWAVPASAAALAVALASAGCLLALVRVDTTPLAGPTTATTTAAPVAATVES